MIGRWSDVSAVSVSHVVFVFMLLEIDVMSGDVFGWFLAIGCLVCVSVFNSVCSELRYMFEMVFPLWSSVYECYREECALTSPVIIMFCFCVYCVRKCVMSVSCVAVFMLACAGGM